MILGRASLYEGFSGYFLPEKKDLVFMKLFKVERALGDWFRGQLLLSLIVGVASFVFLFSIGIPYSLALGFLSGVLEIVPYAGPILSAIPAIIVGLNVSSSAAFAIAAGYIVIHQAENHILVPNVLNRSVQLPQLVIIGAVILGTELGGILGALLAVPIVCVIKALFFDKDFKGAAVAAP